MKRRCDSIHKRKGGKSEFGFARRSGGTPALRQNACLNFCLPFSYEWFTFYLNRDNQQISKTKVI